MSKTDELEKIDALIAQHARDTRRRTILAILGTATLLVVIGGLLFGQDIARQWRAYQFERDNAERYADMSSLELVHVEHLPSWAIRIANQRQDEPQAYATLTETLAEDPILLALLEELRALLLDHDQVIAHAEAMIALVDRWNERMDAAGKPWWVDANVLASADRAFFYLKTYKILADFTVEVGTRPYRTRISARADHTNVVESMLGHTGPDQDGAIILADRIYDFCLSEVWPLLAEKSETLTPTQAAFADRVHEELKAALPNESFDLLATHAEDRRQLEATLAQIRARRQSCGSNFSISDLPWRGFPEDEMAQLRRFAEQDLYSACPSIKEEEVEVIARASQNLSAEEGLEEAVEHLTAYVSRPISIHEARHADDHAEAQAFTEPLACTTCDEQGLSRAARAELSAYLATFASPELPYTALFQTCGIELQRNTPHASALRFVLPALEVDCASTPPDDLRQRARTLEVELFGRSDTITLPKSYPARVELYKK